MWTLETLGAFVALASPASYPAVVPDTSAFRLDEIGLYRVGYAYRGKEPREMPYGWHGHFDDATGVSCLPYGEQFGRKAFLLHCPWRGGTGVAWQEFTIAVPRVRRVSLDGAVAMGSDFVGRSDGAVFRIYVNGSKVLDMLHKDATWRPYTLDLTRYVGQTIRLRFETDPGPSDDPSFDYSLWGDRTLRLDGYAPPKPRPTVRPPLNLAVLAAHLSTDVVPSNAYPGRAAVTVRGAVVTLTHHGADGAYSYTWDTSAPGMGALQLSVRNTGRPAVVVPLATGHRLVWTAEARELDRRVRLLPGGSAAACTKTVQAGPTRATLTVEAHLVGKALAVRLSCTEPVVKAFDAGDWGPTMRRQLISVPYYGSVTYLPREGLFVNRYLDWTASQASRHVEATAYYDSLTDGTRNCLQERAIFAAAWHLAEVLPNIPNPPSPYSREVGGKIVLDVWGGRYTDIAAKLQELHSYGIRNCIVLIHDWQRSGYDNALPMHIPAASDKGGDEGMQQLVATATRLGYRIALHENYVDYYPNYDFFDERHIALDSEGKRVLAWYNPGTKIQSFAVQPNAILRLAQTQSPEIHRRYGTNACYLDVHSAVPPWFHVDFRAGETGAGTFRQVLAAHRRLWAYERSVHGGPVFGEGNSHWYWSGLLDGVEAQFGTGWPSNQGQNAPLMVDFSLLKIHPLQVNHGQGYYERWWEHYPWGAVPPMSVLDQYRLQEVLYGHIGFLGSSTWSKLPYAWLEHHLLTPVTSRHAGVPVRSLDYWVGDQWQDTTSTAIAGMWQRPRVVYANGLTVIGNASNDTWRVHGATLPPNGWIAHGAGVTAYTALRDGVVVDYAATPTTVFANARPVSDWSITDVTAVRPTVARFTQTGDRTFEVTYQWQVAQPPRSDYGCFVHFSSPNRSYYDEGIQFQQDHPLPSPTSSWKANSMVTDGPYTVRIPDTVPDGTYEWSIGLWTPQLGRAALDGPTDRSGRILLGSLIVADHGTTLTFVPNQTPYTSRAASHAAALNTDERVVTFAHIRTNGSVLVERDGSDWVLRPFPRSRAFIVELDAYYFGMPQTVACEDGERPFVQPARSGRWWTLPLNGARAYRWRASPGPVRPLPSGNLH